jgi:hypothetical protein
MVVLGNEHDAPSLFASLNGNSIVIELQKRWLLYYNMLA